MRDNSLRLMLSIIGKMVRCFSGEYLLDIKANGGTVVFSRALHVAFIGLGLVLLINWIGSCKVVASYFQWFVTAFAATYAALYARFASQWTYLAGVYNQIKSAETKVALDDSSRAALAQWKAGFIEDAHTLHLLRKPMFAAIVRAWGQDEEVRNAFIDGTPAGKRRFEDFMCEADGAARSL